MSWKEPPKGIEEARRTLDLQRRQRLNHHDEQGLTAADKAPEWEGLTVEQIGGLLALVQTYLVSLFPAGSGINYSAAMFIWTHRETDDPGACIGDFCCGGITDEGAMEMIKEWLEPNKDGRPRRARPVR